MVYGKYRSRGRVPTQSDSNPVKVSKNNDLITSEVAASSALTVDSCIAPQAVSVKNRVGVLVAVYHAHCTGTCYEIWDPDNCFKINKNNQLAFN